MDEERLKRHDLTDEEWARLEPLLPVSTGWGARWNDHRTVINGVFHRTRTGTSWRDLPPCYGKWKTAYNRHRRWSLDGTWEQILDGLRAGCDEVEGEDWTVSADSTVVRAHQHAAGARHAPAVDIPVKGPGKITNGSRRAGRRSAGREAAYPPKFTWSPIGAAVRSPGSPRRASTPTARGSSR